MWDARTYDQVSSNVQQAWGEKVVDWKRWQGNEKVMDAGCGTGRLSQILAERVPSGIVYAVDLDSNMINIASINLQQYTNVHIIKADLSTVKLPTRVDVIFSNATIHWILDHRTLFENFWSLLNDEGEMIIQCGGLGNLDKVIYLIDEVKHSPTFCNFFALWKKTWNFPTPGETSRILEQIGFKDINVNLVNEPVAFPDRNNFGLFARTVIMKPYLAILPSARLQNMFIDSVLDKIEQQNNGEPWVIDYVRLNIKAKKN